MRIKRVISLIMLLMFVLSLVITPAMPVVAQPTKSVPLNPNDGMFPPRKTGLKWIPLEEYSKLTGNKYPVMDYKAFKEALEYAPFYLGRSQPLSSPEPNSLPSKVVNTEYLPPVGSQGYVGSCVGWSSTYYVWTYMINWWRSNPHPDSPDEIMNPTFTYNLINGGWDQGAFMWDAMNLISTIGAVPLTAFPLYVKGPYGDPENYAWVWPNLTQWMIAPHNSGNPEMYFWQLYDSPDSSLYNNPGDWYILYLDNETQWNYLKELLYKGYVIQTAILVLPSFDYLNHPEDIVGRLDRYIRLSKNYSDMYWTTGDYADWTVRVLLSWVQTAYSNINPGRNITPSIELMKDVLTKDFGVSLDDTIPEAVQKINATFYTRFVNNETWWEEASFYLSTYSLRGEEWFVNNAFVDIYALLNFMWMLYYIPEGTYVKSGRINYIDFLTFYQAWTGGHAVTIIGYDDNTTTPDGKGALIMVNSWGTDWGDNGFWKYSYKAARTYTYHDYRYGNPYVISVRDIISLPVFISYGEAFVYVPKAADYKPKLMTVVGIKHPYRGEVIDGVYNATNYEILYWAGIPVGVAVNGSPVWEHSFLDFWMDYISDKELSIIKQNVNEIESILPQAHPFPDSPMAFDVSEAIDYIMWEILESNITPLTVDFYVAPKDILADNFTGVLYNFTVLLNINGELKVLGSLDKNVSIPDGSWTIVPLEIPVVSYDKAPNNVTIKYGDFNVSIYSIIPLEGAKVVIGGKEYPLKAEEGGYYYYGTEIAEKLELSAGTYNYTVVVTYPNGKEVALPSRIVTISGPTIKIVSPVDTVYNVTTIPIEVLVNHTLKITNVTAEVGGKSIELTYNATSGYYTGKVTLENGAYTLVVTATDELNNVGTARVHFVVSANAKVTPVTVENTTVTVGVTGNATITVTNDTVVANVTTSEGTYEVKVPVVNNAPAIFVNSTAIEDVVKGKANATLVAGWNVTVTTKTEVGKPEEIDGKLHYPVTVKADVKLGQNGVAVIALRDINISKIYIIKNGQKIQLTTNESDTIGYYYIENGVIFVVVKQDPTIIAYGSYTKPAPVRISIPVLNFLGYSWYKLYSQKFEELYNEAIKLGIDNETLGLALKYHEKAAEYYSKVLELTGGNILYHLRDIRLFAPLRGAYVNEMKAVRILEKAIKELQGEES
ncbi:C1 family peptidase [Pyrococcus abyssi]|nr:C1 family peptidase [Pyrococcus abyssi]